MTPEEMAEIHARAMRVPPPWGVPTMAGFLSAPGAVFVCERRAFGLGRVIADEAELLTIAVEPDAQGQGLGRSCLRRFMAACAERGAARIFLEVAASNDIARGLYASEGFAEDGLRKGYYRLPEGGAVDAVLMSRVLSDRRSA